jgi:hypothetical protein
MSDINVLRRGEREELLLQTGVHPVCSENVLDE